MRQTLPIILLLAFTTQSAWARHEDIASIKALIQAGKVQQADAACRELVTRQPGRADVHLMYGDFLQSTGQMQGAIAELQKALELDPHLSDAYVELAEIQLQMLNIDAATQNALAALKLAPSSTRARAVYVNALLQSGHTSQADSELGSLLAASKDDPSLLYLAYEIKERKGDFNQARSYLQQAVERRPNNSEWLLDLCKLAENAGDYETSRQMLRNALQRKPDDVQLRLRLARNIEAFEHDYDSAQKEFSTCLQMDPDSPEALAGVDRCRAKKNDLALRLKLGVQTLFGVGQPGSR